MAPKRSSSSPGPKPSKKVKHSAASTSKKAKFTNFAASSSSAPQENLGLPSSWFKDSRFADAWMNGFNNRKVCFSESADLEFLESIDRECIKIFKKSTLWSMLDLESIAYPRLTRLFYVNLEVDTHYREPVIKSVVGGENVLVTKELIAKVLRIQNDAPALDPLLREERVKKAKEEFFSASPSSSKQLTHNVLTMEAKIVFNLLVRCVVPRTFSKELITDQLLELVYLVLHGHPVDLPDIIMTHMMHAVHSTRPIPLPYANLLPRIFEYYEIPTKDEELERSPVKKINEDLFQRLGITKTLKGKWVLRPAKVSSDTPPSHDKRLEILECAVDSIKLDLVDLKRIVQQSNDGVYEVVAQINQMFMLNSLTFAATGSIMPLEKDAATYAQERAAKILHRCEAEVKGRIKLRPPRGEPKIFTVEEYGVIKKRLEKEDREKAQEVMVDARLRSRAKREEAARTAKADKGKAPMDEPRLTD